MSQIRETDELSAWWRPGTPPGWVTSVIALASAITVAIAYAGAHRVIEFGRPHHEPSWWLRNGLALGLAIALAASWVWPWRLARSLRVALVLPIAHAVGVGAAWIAWRHLRLANDDAAAAAVLTRIMPLAW
ncbi:MAG TPA: hypothetical protein VLX92_13205, partial [Kofleriaceae bacterium]|nr:hypothetical protein [Kofleriaceae bacterium]